MERLGKSNGTTIYEHSVIVARIAYNLSKRLFIESKQSEFNSNVVKAALFHDIGKSIDTFQRFVSDGEEAEQYELHNVVSWAYYSYYLTANPNVDNAILYHHPLAYRDAGTTNLHILEKIGEENVSAVKEEVEKLIKHWGRWYSFGWIGHKKEGDVREDPMPPYYYKSGGSRTNETILAIKSCLIAADRLASQADNETYLLSVIHDRVKMDEYINAMLDKEYEMSAKHRYVCPKHFDYERFALQESIATEAALSKESAVIVKAPAGFGKTVTGLLWSFKLGRKVLWVCPINTIASSTYASIVRELKGYNVKVELLIANEIKERNYDTGEDADITVTNIDNFLNPTIRNENARKCYNLLYHSVIFDEFHELVSDCALFAGFVNIMSTRCTLCRNARTLLLSATPVPIQNLWEMRSTSTKVISNIPPMNNDNGKYRFSFVDGIDYDKTDTLYMLNSVRNSQDAYMDNTDKVEMLMHSAFTAGDKELLRKRVIELHGKEAVQDRTANVIGTRIIGTGLDISFGGIYETIASPELTVQSIGRVNRYGESDEPCEVRFVRPDAKEKCAINVNFNTKLTTMWQQYLEKREGMWTLRDIYAMYDEIHANPTYKMEYRRFVGDKLEKSRKALGMLVPSRVEGKGDIIKAKKYSLRSSEETRFVVCRKEGSEELIEEPMNIPLTRITQSGEAEYGRDKRRKYITFLDKRNKGEYGKLLDYARYNTMPFVLLSYTYKKNVGLYKN